MSNFNNGTQIGSILMEDCNQVDTKLNGILILSIMQA